MNQKISCKKSKLLEKPQSLSEKELLELILGWFIQEKKIKNLIQVLSENFINLSDIIYSDLNKFVLISNTNEKVYSGILLIREMIRRIMQNDIINKCVFSFWGKLLDYLKYTMGNLKIEEFRVLILDKKNLLVADEIQYYGTIDQVSVYPREIIKQALIYKARSIILVHNHPSGSAFPSKVDIEVTKHIANACKIFNLSVHDHLIIGKNKTFSFKSNLLL